MMAGTIYHAYCDESCTDKGHTHMVLAGIMATASAAGRFRAHVLGWRAQANMTSELKWSKVTNAKSPQYQEYVAIGMGHVQAKALAFRSLVLRKSDLDYHGYHEGDNEKAFRRFIYMLVFNCFCPMLQDGDQLVLYLDERDGTPLNELRDILNRALVRTRNFAQPPIQSANWLNSKRSEVMQFNDVLMGAVACHNNGRHMLESTRQSKIDLAAAIARTAGHPNLCVSTPRSATHFGIWQFRLRPKINGNPRT